LSAASVGALVALEAGRTALAAPLVLVAPALGFGRRWVEKLPPGDALAFFDHGEERELLIHRRFFEDLARVDADEHPPSTPVIVIMGRRDESVPIESSRTSGAAGRSPAGFAKGLCQQHLGAPLP
jgi:pimeloyl-ACP methyl ester carboxylesterase